MLVAINDSAHGANLLANFQEQRRFLVLASVLAGACALAIGVVRSLPSAATAEPNPQAAVGAHLAALKCGRASPRARPDPPGHGSPLNYYVPGLCVLPGLA